MCLEEKIKSLLDQDAKGNPFLASLSLKYKEDRHILIVEYGSCLGLYDVYDIGEGINQREESNHVKYKFQNKTLTILVDEDYGWIASKTTSTDILRLPKEINDIKIEFF